MFLGIITFCVTLIYIKIIWNLLLKTKFFIIDSEKLYIVYLSVDKKAFFQTTKSQYITYRLFSGLTIGPD